MKCTATLIHDGHIMLRTEDGREAFFRPGKATLTGARHRNNQLMCLTAVGVRRFLQLNQLRKFRDSTELETDKGIFDAITAIELDMNAKRCYDHIPVGLHVLRGACYLAEKKEGKS